MSKSFQEVVSDGTLRNIVLSLDYLAESDIYLRIAGEDIPKTGHETYSWVFSNNIVTITPAVTTGYKVVVYRRTATTEMLNIYGQNAQFSESSMDENFTQLLYLSQEYMEQGSGTELISEVRFIRSDAYNNYYRLVLNDGSTTPEFTIPKAIAEGATVGTFAAGCTLSNVGDTALHSDGHIYGWTGTFPHTISAGSFPTPLGVGYYVDRSDVLLRTQLSRLVSEVISTGRLTLSDLPSVMDWGAIGDGTLHTLQEWVTLGKFSGLTAIQLMYPKATALTDSIDAIAIQQCQDDNPDKGIILPGGHTFLIDRTLYLNWAQCFGPSGAWRSGPSGGYDLSVFDNTKGAKLLLVGTGPRVHTVDYVTASKQCGYDRPNPVRNYNNAFDAEFLLTDFTNKDAFGTTKATLKPFSVGVILGSGKMDDIHPYGLVNIQVVTSCPGSGETYGLGGYSNISTIVPWADWDIGVWCRSPWRCKIRDCHIVGYYNIRGMLTTNMAVATDGSTSTTQGFSEYFKMEDTVVQGGYSARSGDIWPIKSKTVDSLTVQWTSSHRFNTTGTLDISNASTVTYTGLTYNAGASELIFTGCSSTVGVVVDNTTGNRSVIRTTQNGGLANSVFRDCEFNDFSHATRIEEQSPAFGARQMLIRSAVEISGHPCRAPYFDGCSVFGSGPVMFHFGNARNVEFNSCYSEPKAYYKSEGGAIQGAGSCWVCGPKADYIQYIPNYDMCDIRSAGQFVTSYLNVSPEYDTNAGRYAGNLDMFNPRFVTLDQRNNPVTVGEYRFVANNGDSAGIYAANASGSVRRGVTVSPDAVTTIGSGFGTSGETILSDRLITQSNPSGVTHRTINTSAGIDQKMYEWRQMSGLGNLYFSMLSDDTVTVNDILSFFRTGAGLDVLSINPGRELRSSGTGSVIVPAVDNVSPVCTAGRRATTIYLGTAPNVTSDERQKVNILPIDDAALDAWGNVQYYQYTLVDGTSDRRHTGCVVQRIIKAFTDAGLDALAYGLCCHEEWDAQAAKYDSDGTLIQAESPAGDIWTLRYDEVYAFEAAYQRRRADRMEARLLALEAKIGS